MKRTALARRTPLKAKTPLRASTPLRRTAAPKKRPRSKAESLRVYGTPEFRDYLHAHPCLWCGRLGVEQAHLRGNDGMSRKAGWRTTGPLCGPDGGACHNRWDMRSPVPFWFNPAQRRSILIRMEQFHEEWRRRST